MNLTLEMTEFYDLMDTVIFLQFVISIKQRLHFVVEGFPTIKGMGLIHEMVDHFNFKNKNNA